MHGATIKGKPSLIITTSVTCFHWTHSRIIYN